jgi:small glutamine-rich tetratricopeptide repeat-containing protein alpha
LGDYKAAAAAFKKGVELDPTNANLKSGLQNAMDRIPSEDDDDDGPPPLVPEGDIPLSDTRGGPGAGAAGLGGMADMFRNMGGMGGAGGAGGMPDLASLMNNPMMMQMAQQMMANGGMERLMSNPNVANMVGVFPLLYVPNHSDHFFLDESDAVWWSHALYGRTYGRSRAEESVS